METLGRRIRKHPEVVKRIFGGLNVRKVYFSAFPFPLPFRFNGGMVINRVFRHNKILVAGQVKSKFEARIKIIAESSERIPTKFS